MKYLSSYTEQAQTNLFNELKICFAFSNKQLEEGAQKLLGHSVEKMIEAGTKVINLGAGCYMFRLKDENPKEKVDLFNSRMENIQKDAVKLHHQEYGAEKIIEQAYFNHETQITMDNRDAYSSLSTYQEIFPDEYSLANCKKVFSKCFQKAIDNNWF